MTYLPRQTRTEQDFELPLDTLSANLTSFSVLVVCMGAALRSPALLDNPAFVGVLSTFVGAISNLVGVAKEAADRLYLGNLPEVRS